MKQFLSYLWGKRWLLLGLFLCGALATLVYFLFDLPPIPYFYALALDLFVGAVALVLDFAAFLRKHRLLSALRRQVEVGMEYLPRPHTALEADYQAVLREASQSLRTQGADFARREKDAVDYYTLWVHQIKTPIAAMNLLLREDTDENRALQAELFKIEQYTEMVLCYLRLEDGGSDYVIKTYDLDGILRQALRKFGPQFIRRRLALDYGPIHSQILTDEKWFLFVVEQVLSNALKYTRSGTITLSLAAPQILSIRDTGIGIAPEDLPRIFERGYTGCNGRLDKRSTGIGLYLCRRICKNLGHTITARSQAGVGTEIRIDFSRNLLEVE